MNTTRSFRETFLIFLTAVLSAIAVAAVAAAIGTDYWFYANLKNLHNVSTIQNDQSYIRFGLIEGEQRQDVLGNRESQVFVVCDIDESLCGLSSKKGDASIVGTTLKDLQDEKNSNSTEIQQIGSGLFSFPLWVATLASAGLTILAGIVSICFSLLNTCTKPIETINGPRGLYLWHAIPALLTLVTVAIYLVLFFKYLSNNVISGEIRKQLWTSKDLGRPDYSFYILVAACPLFLLNLVLIKFSGFEIRFRRKDDRYEASGKDIMLF